MQTNIRTTTTDNSTKKLNSAKTINHEDINVIVKKMPVSDPVIVNPILYIDISDGGHVLDITTTPPAILGIQFDEKGDINPCSGLSLCHHGRQIVGLINRGNIIDSRQIASIAPRDSGDYTAGTVVTLASPLGATPYIEGDIKDGYFGVNGQYLYVSIGNYSEQKVYINDCGVLDAEGDKYVYDAEDPDMVQGEEIEDAPGTYYGIYPKCDGAVVADALNRCINGMFNVAVVNVAYEDNRFIISAAHNLVSSIAIYPDPYSIASLLGLYGKNTSHITQQDIDGKTIYLGEDLIDSNPTLETDGSILLAVDYAISFSHKIAYLLDPDTETTVKILSA